MTMQNGGLQSRLVPRVDAERWRGGLSAACLAPMLVQPSSAANCETSYDWVFLET